MRAFLVIVCVFMFSCTGHRETAAAEFYQIISHDVSTGHWVIVHVDTERKAHVKITAVCDSYQSGNQEPVTGRQSCVLVVGEKIIPNGLGKRRGEFVDVFQSGDTLFITRGKGADRIRQQFSVQSAEAIEPTTFSDIGSFLTRATINPTIAAALLTLLGGALALVWNRWEKRRQEFHDLRRGIYLEAAEAYSAMMTYLNSMSSHATSLAQGQLVLERMLQCSGKIHLVAKQRVIESTIALVDNLVTAFNDLSRLKGQSEDLIRDVNRKMPAIQEGTRMIFAPPAGTNRQELAQVVARLERENRDAASQVDALAWQMIDRWTELYSLMAPFVSQAVLAVKSELNISVDSDWYINMTNDMFAEDIRRRTQRLADIRPAQQTRSDEA